MALLDVELQQVWGGEALPAHGAGVSVSCIVVELRLYQLGEGLGAARRLAAELFVVSVKKLLDVVQSEQGGGGHPGLLVTLGQCPGGRALH